jgi:hypothetical protein
MNPSDITDEFPPEAMSEDPPDFAITRRSDGRYIIVLDILGVEVHLARETTLKVIETAERALAQLDLWVTLERKHHLNHVRENPLAP